MAVTAAIRDEYGTVLVSDVVPPRTIHWGDHVSFHLKLKIPEHARPRQYTASIQIPQMRQGDAVREFGFEVVDAARQQADSVSTN